MYTYCILLAKDYLAWGQIPTAKAQISAPTGLLLCSPFSYFVLSLFVPPLLCDLSTLAHLKLWVLLPFLPFLLSPLPQLNHQQ